MSAKPKDQGNMPKRAAPIAGVSWRIYGRDLLTTLHLVWSTSPLQTLVAVGLSFVQAFIPAVTIWISKLLLDAVAGATQGRLGTPEEAFTQLLGLLAFQVGVGVVSSILSAAQGSNRELLGDALQNRISLRILHKASGLELSQFEDAETYDTLQNAYREVGSRPLGVFTQVVSLVQSLITLGTVSALLSQLGLGVVPLVLLATSSARGSVA